jgi:hypothetical protein
MHVIHKTHEIRGTVTVKMIWMNNIIPKIINRYNGNFYWENICVVFI